MSTTNPPPGNPPSNPLPGHPPSGGDPVSALAPREPGSPTPDEADRGGGPPASVIKRGYEADGYDARSVIGVPILVIVFFVLAFTSVTIMFAYFRHTPVDPMAHPQAVKAGEKSLAERIGDTPARGRPEPLKRLDPRGGDPRAITRPALAEGNPPEFHPEQIRPSPENTPTLYETKRIDEKFSRIPLDDAAALALALKAKGEFMKVREGATDPTASSDAPSGSNAGRGTPPPLKPAAKDPKDAKGGKH
jgi:hypothetical protein